MRRLLPGSVHGSGFLVVIPDRSIKTSLGRPAAATTTAARLLYSVSPPDWTLQKYQRASLLFTAALVFGVHVELVPPVDTAVFPVSSADL